MVAWISAFGEVVSAKHIELMESVRATSAEKILIAIKFFPVSLLLEKLSYLFFSFFCLWLFVLVAA
jgi:membrane protein required for beta-lactamase induction